MWPHGHIAKCSRRELAKHNGTAIRECAKIWSGKLVGRAMRGAGACLLASVLRSPAWAALALCALIWPEIAFAEPGEVVLPEVNVIGTTPVSRPRVAPKGGGGQRATTP